MIQDFQDEYSVADLEPEDIELITMNPDHLPVYMRRNALEQRIRTYEHALKNHAKTPDQRAKYDALIDMAHDELARL